MGRGKTLIAIGVIVIMTGCTKQAPATVVESPYRLTASIQDIMLSVVDPAADALWESVSTKVDATGTHDNVPATDADWLALRHRALELIEATNLLVIPGRQVAEPGVPLQDANLPGILTAAEIQTSVNKDHADFVRHAHVLHSAGLMALKAIDSRNVQALEDSGGQIDDACEQCHLKYWYPPVAAAH